MILPSGNIEKSILATTIYLIPFHPRDFGCAYLPTSSGISDSVKDDYLTGKLNITATEQVQLFITLAQLAGHPVIYDILPQTGRFSKEVLSNPGIVRWMDVNQLISSLEHEIDDIVKKYGDKYDSDDIQIVQSVAKATLKSGSDDMGEHYKKIYNDLSEKLLPKRKQLSEKMLVKNEQQKIVARVKQIVASVHCTTTDKITSEEDITKQGEVISRLIEEGLWSVPGGAWCSAGAPVFEKMSESGDFPIFKHYDYKGNDVSRYANLDCQSPYFFVHLENGEFNQPVINYYINRVKQMCKLYAFDGVRVDHIDHVVDEYSQKGDRPISYRIPKQVLAKCNDALKQENKHFAIVAEYMLGGNNIKAYHREMHFDVLWGNDIICQFEKTPLEIINNNQSLKQYNESLLTKGTISVLKTYNNQDGEFRDINQYPGQLGEQGALFKWFKMKFIPGGKKAQRPVMFVDGDESYTTVGTEECIGSEVSLKRAKNYGFFEKFDAINRFALKNNLTTDGEAQIVTQNDNGFVCWVITNKPQSKETLLVAANYFAPIEKVCESENGKTQCTIREGTTVYDSSIEVPKEYKIISEYAYDFNEKEYIENEYKGEGNTLYFDRLEPSEFRFFKLIKQ